MLHSNFRTHEQSHFVVSPYPIPLYAVRTGDGTTCNTMSKKLFLCLAAALLALGGSPSSSYVAQPCTERPIIGILTQPTEEGLQKYGTSKLQAGM